MAVERKFIDEALTKFAIARFLEERLDRAGFASIDIQRTPMVTRINVEVLRPGKVIGRKGRTIRELTEALKEKFGIDNPQIVVTECTQPMLRPRIVAKRVCRLIERGKRVRPVLHSMLREIMENGALGAEIVASGKLAGKGGRARSIRVAAGYLPKAGEPANYVLKDHYTAYPKPGAIGVYVRIVPPGTQFPDKEVKTIELPAVVSRAERLKSASEPEPEPSKTTKDAEATIKRRRVRR
ncbi:30S ribosomal protein S3 [Candidatus Micrarchaeota archaeon]|nr:30S ribosomal protein S3 [Candidatus Micrarchaeota archaeon]